MSPIGVFLDWFSNFYLFDWLALAVFLGLAAFLFLRSRKE